MLADEMRTHRLKRSVPPLRRWRSRLPQEHVASLCLLGATCLSTGSCGSSGELTNPETFELEVNKIVNVNRCNLKADRISTHAVALDYVCGCGPASPGSEEWWGSCGSPGGGLGVRKGDCIPLGERYYCLDAVDEGEQATFVAAFETEGVPPVLRRVAE